MDRALESRGRYYGELMAHLDAPVDPVVRALRGSEEELLGHEVLAAAAACGHAASRRLLDDGVLPLELRVALAGWLVEWGAASPVELPAPVRERVLADMLDLSDSAAVARGLRARPSETLEDRSVDELLELARDARVARLDALTEALAKRTTPAERGRMWACVRDDVVHGRVRTAARALGAMGDESALPLCEEFFGLPDGQAGGDGAPQLTGFDRMRRSALAAYCNRLPAARQRQLARQWHPRGGYFSVVAGTMFEEHATQEDRGYLERCVRAELDCGTGWQVICELDALRWLADVRTVPLFVAVAEQADYSHARRRAVHALALHAREGGVEVAPLREALWDCEDEAVADACAFLPALDGRSLARVRALAELPAAEPELRERAARRLARG